MNNNEFLKWTMKQDNINPAILSSLLNSFSSTNGNFEDNEAEFVFYWDGNITGLEKTKLLENNYDNISVSLFKMRGPINFDFSNLINCLFLVKNKQGTDEKPGYLSLYINEDLIKTEKNYEMIHIFGAPYLINVKEDSKILFELGGDGEIKIELDLKKGLYALGTNEDSEFINPYLVTNLLKGDAQQNEQTTFNGTLFKAT